MRFNLSCIRLSSQKQQLLVWGGIVLSIWVYCIPLALAMDAPEGWESGEYTRLAKRARTFASTTDASSSAKKTVRILTIDGGGINSIIPVTILEKIEEHLQVDHKEQEIHLANYFDIMAATSTSSILALGLSTHLSAEDIAKLYLKNPNKLFSPSLSPSEGQPLYNAQVLEATFQSLFGEKWLKEAVTHILISADNLGQTCAYLFDSKKASRPSYNFKMKDIARAACARINDFPAVTIRDEKGLDEHRFSDGERYAYDPTFEAIKAAEREYPGCDLFIVSLGTGEAPRRFGNLILPQGDTLLGEGQPYENMRHQKDRHLGYLDCIKGAFKQQGRKVKYIRLQVPVDLILNHTSRIENIKNLRDAGLSFTNPQNKKHKKFRKILKNLKSWITLEQFPGQPVGSDFSSKEGSFSSRLWKKVEGEVFDNLYDAPPVEGLIESYPEGSSKSYLTKLWEQLHKSQYVTISSCSKAALSGMGGIGKTSLASQYAHEALGHQAYKLIYWFASETEDKLKESYENLLDLLDVKAEKGSNLRKLLSLVNKHLSKQEPYLLIYDNVPDSRFLDNKIPTRKGHILMTSRCQEGWYKSINLDVFRPQDAVKYIFESINIGPHKIVEDEENRKLALQIAEELGYLPLALSHAVGYIPFQKKTLSNYLVELKKKLSIIFKTSKFDPNGQEGSKLSHERLIEATWEMAADKVSERAKELIQYFAYLDPGQIVPEVFIQENCSKEDIDTALGELEAYSLIKQNQKILSMHRLIQLVLRERQESTDQLSQLLILIDKLLLSFFKYWKSIDAELEADFNLSSLNTSYQMGAVLVSNIEKFYKHLDRLEISRKLEANKAFGVKVGALCLLRLFKYTLGELMEEILHNSQETDSESQVEISSGELIEDELLGLEHGILQKSIESLSQIDPGLLLELVEIAKPLLTPKMDGWERARVIESLSQIDPRRLLELVEIAKPLFTPEMDGWERAGVMKSLSQIDPRRLLELVEITKPLFASKMDGWKWARVIEVLSQIDPARLSGLVRTIIPFLSSGIGMWNYKSFIKSLKEIDSARLSELLEIAKLLFIPEMDGWEGVWVIEILSQIDPARLSELLGIAKPLFTSEMPGFEWAGVIKSLSEIDSARLSELLEIAKPLFTPEMHGSERAGVIEILSQIDPARLLEFIQNVPLFLSLGIDIWSYESFIRSLRGIDPAQLPELIEIAKPLFTPEMRGSERAGVIEILSQVDPARLLGLVEITKPLFISEMDGWYRVLSIKSLSKTDPGRLSELLEGAEPLLTPEINGLERTRIIGSLSQIDPGRLPGLVEIAKPFLTPEVHGLERARVIEILSQIDPGRLPGLVEIAKPFLTPEVHGLERARVIETLSQIDPARLLEFIQNVTLFLSSGIVIWNYKSFIKSLSQIDPAWLSELLEVAKPLLIPEMDGWERTRVIEILSKTDPARLPELVEIILPLLTSKTRRFERAGVIEILSRVDPARLPEVVEIILPLLTSKTRRFERAGIIEILSRVDPARLPEVVEIIKPLLTSKMDRFKRASVIESLSRVDPARLPGLVEIAKPLLIPEMNEFEQAEVIEFLAQIDPARLPELIEIAKPLLTFKTDRQGLQLITHKLSKIDPKRLPELAEKTKYLLTSMDTENQLEIIEPISLHSSSPMKNTELKEIIQCTLLIDPVSIIDIFEQALGLQSEESSLQGP